MRCYISSLCFRSLFATSLKKFFKSFKHVNNDRNSRAEVKHLSVLTVFKDYLFLLLPVMIIFLSANSLVLNYGRVHGPLTKNEANLTCGLRQLLDLQYCYEVDYRFSSPRLILSSLIFPVNNV